MIDKLLSRNEAGETRLKNFLITFLLLTALFVVAFSIAYFSGLKKQVGSITSFIECEKFKESIIQESYPRVCRLPNGKSFTEVIKFDGGDLNVPNHDPINETKTCIISGCNDEICQDASNEPMASVCLLIPEFSCYKNATCEVQKDTGECGWTVTDELISCLNKY